MPLPRKQCLAKQIWEWCIFREVWLTVAHITGKEKTEADKESRLSRRKTDWTVQTSLFKAATDKLGVIQHIDLFASRLNYQRKPYIAYKPDPEAHAINAFHFSWRDCLFLTRGDARVYHELLQRLGYAN